jgi:hypothetical protein
MKHKLLLLIGSLIVVFNSLYGQKYAVFENFKDSCFSISQTEVRYLQTGEILNDSCFFSEEKITNLTALDPCAVPSLIADILYAQIRKKLYFKYDTLEKPILLNRPKQGITFHYIGVIPINSEYESYVFMADHQSHDYSIFTYRHFFMINIQEKRLMSIFNIAEYISFWGESDLEFTIIQAPGILTRKYESMVSDIIYANEDDARKAKEEQIKYDALKTKNYKLNAQGHIELKDE